MGRCALFILFLSLSLLTGLHSEPAEERQALLRFYTGVPHSGRLRWNSSDSACSWVGIECSPDRANVISIHLPGVGLVGSIPQNTIGRLSELRVLSLRSNGLNRLPPDFINLKSLRNLYLQSNRLSGGFPKQLTGLSGLTRLDLSSNNFSGEIPFSVNNLTRLTGLFLQNNQFSGSIPNINSPLQSLNVSFNNLNGSIPRTLVRFSTSSFAGNADLCGRPLPACSSTFFPPSPSPTPSPASPVHRKSKKLSTGAIVGICLGGAAALLILLFLLFCLLCRRRKQQPERTPKPVARSVPVAPGEAVSVASSSKEVNVPSAGEGEGNKLVLVDRGVYSFDLEDLLRASAEVLGKGSVGTSYKAVLEEGTTVVVKRLKDVTAGKREFEQQMDLLGRIKHENVVPLRAYYFSKDEKLLVYDYLPAGSLSAALHGSRGAGRMPLDWENRVKIAVSTGRGLAHLHGSCNLVHGNLKASNVLLQNGAEAALSDYGLSPLFGQTTPLHRAGGYRAPESVETRKVTFKSDVYSYGVLVLELLTGKAPNQASIGDEGVDLPRWVQSVVREEWTAEVFDPELLRYQHIEEEMVQLLQVAMACVSTVPDQRPNIREAVRMITEMNRSESDEGARQFSDDASKPGGTGGATAATTSAAASP